MKEADVLNPYIDYKLYREEMDRVEKELELRRTLPRRTRRRLPHVQFSLSRPRRQRLAGSGGC